jgi:hypothetical protein
MGAAAAGAIIGFVLAVDDMIAALVRLRDDAAAARFKDTRRHNSWLLLTHLPPTTSDEFEEFHGLRMNGVAQAAARPARGCKKSQFAATMSRSHGTVSRFCNR